MHALQRSDDPLKLGPWERLSFYAVCPLLSKEAQGVALALIGFAQERGDKCDPAWWTSEPYSRRIRTLAARARTSGPGARRGLVELVLQGLVAVERDEEGGVLYALSPLAFCRLNQHPLLLVEQ
jgi:hypothetical protein